MFSNKTLLITGGTGSFGQAVLGRFLQTDIREIRIFSRDEKKQHDLRQALKDQRVKYYIGDSRDRETVAWAMRGVDAVFHAAALKQVPSCEFYPIEAVKTNVLGTENVLNEAIAAGVSRVVVLSTDKAVYPINAMGMSKALMEKVTVAKSRGLSETATVLCATRYGNVMASRGSVIPLFIEQILCGKELTVTNPEMTRFLMSLDNAVDLVLHGMSRSKQGDIFVQKAPAATVMTVAQALCEIFEVKPRIKVIGTRHGEKLFESLLTREEMSVAEDQGRYYRIPADSRDLNYERYFSEGGVRLVESDYNSHNTQRLDKSGVIDLLLGLPEVKEALRQMKDQGIRGDQIHVN